MREVQVSYKVSLLYCKCVFRPAVTGIASGRSLVYIVSNLLTSSFYLNNPGVFVYRTDLPLTLGVDNIHGELCHEYCIHHGFS